MSVSEISITIRIMPSADDIEVTLPLEARPQEIFQALFSENLRIPRIDPNGFPYLYCLTKRGSNFSIGRGQPLRSAGVKEGDLLVMMIIFGPVFLSRYIPLMTRKKDVVLQFLDYFYPKLKEEKYTKGFFLRYTKGISSSSDFNAHEYVDIMKLLAFLENSIDSIYEVSWQIDSNIQEEEHLALSHPTIRELVQIHYTEDGGMVVEIATRGFPDQKDFTNETDRIFEKMKEYFKVTEGLMSFDYPTIRSLSTFNKNAKFYDAHWWYQID